MHFRRHVVVRLRAAAATDYRRHGNEEAPRNATGCRKSRITRTIIINRHLCSLSKSLGRCVLRWRCAGWCRCWGLLLWSSGRPGCQSSCSSGFSAASFSTSGSRPLQPSPAARQAVWPRQQQTLWLWSPPGWTCSRWLLGVAVLELSHHPLRDLW